MNFNYEDFKDFLREITTFKTVWIDKGQGRWTTKKRMHPVLRLICVTSVVLVCGISYASYAMLFPKNTQQKTQSNKITRQTITFAMPEPPTELPPYVINSNNQIKQTEPEITPKLEIKESPKKSSEAPNNNFTRVQTVNNDNKYDNKYRIVVTKSDYKLSLFKGNELIKQYPIAVGKNPGDKQYRGDHRTPVGNFKVVSIENASSWSHDFRDGKGKIKGAYGPWFLRLDAKGWKGIGIHGTHDPDSRGSMATEGCVRLSNEDIQELRQYAYLNMPVVIREK